MLDSNSVEVFLKFPMCSLPPPPSAAVPLPFFKPAKKPKKMPLVGQKEKKNLGLIEADLFFLIVRILSKYLRAKAKANGRRRYTSLSNLGKAFSCPILYFFHSFSAYTFCRILPPFLYYLNQGFLLVWRSS